MDYTHRDERERRLARLIAGLGTQQRRQLLDIMGDPPKIENVGAEYWDGALHEWSGLMTPELESIFVDSAVEMMGQWPGLGVDWGLVNQDAANWVRRHGAELTRDLNENTRRGVDNAIADFYEQGLNMGQLEDKLGRWFGPSRAVTIAVTEVTRASVEGERAIVNELAAEGIQMKPVWKTNADELVCPLCSPRNGQVIMDGMYPPLHTRCRCWVSHELIMPMAI